MKLPSNIKQIATLSVIIAVVTITLFLVALNLLVEKKDENYELVMIIGIIYFSLSSVLKAILASEYLSQRKNK